MEARPVFFENGIGLRLAGELTVAGAGAPLVVFSHGLYSGKDSPRNRQIAAALVAHGISTFLFDYTGHGESEGSIEESTIERQVGDLGSALNFLAGQPAVGPMGVNGSSTGGTVALLRAAGDDRIGALVVRSARDYGVSPVASAVRVPTLVIVGGEDILVAGEAERIYLALGGPREFLVVPGAGHLFEDPEHMRQVTAATVGWFERHLAAVGAAGR